MNPGGHIDDKNPEEDQIITKLIKKRIIPKKMNTSMAYGAMKDYLECIIIK